MAEHPILVVEDDPKTLERIVQAIDAHPDLCVVGSAASLEEARQQLAAGTPPDAALVDLGLPDGNGVQLIQEICRVPPHPAVLVITALSDEAHVIRALEAGATGYLLKEQAPAAIGDAVISVLHGESPISPGIARHLLQRFRPRVPDGGAGQLSPREVEVLTLIVKGYTYKEIAHHLGVSIHTITAHTKHLYRKLAVHSRSEAAYEAVQLGIVDI